MIKTDKQLKSSDIPGVRDTILEEQKGKCALCGELITDKTGVSLDHQHKTKKEELGVDGAGEIRGVLDRACNCLEGKIWNSMTRFLQPENVQERIEFLESLIQYYKKDNYNLIHPNEKPKEPQVSKKNYNKLKKLYTQDLELKLKKKKFPEYPKSKKLTLGLQVLFEEYNINPYN